MLYYSFKCPVKIIHFDIKLNNLVSLYILMAFSYMGKLN